jgi:hypothetical protein
MGAREGIDEFVERELGSCRELASMEPRTRAALARTLGRIAIAIAVKDRSPEELARFSAQARGAWVFAQEVDSGERSNGLERGLGSLS